MMRFLRSESPSQRAEKLLAQFLSPEQQLDWDRNRAFDVVGRYGASYRVNPGYASTHAGVVRQDGLGIAVWPVGLGLKADVALAMLLYLQDNDQIVVTTGCHLHMPSKYRPRSLT